MLDLPQAASLQRSHGEARVHLGLRGGRPVLAGLYQRGSGKAFLPLGGGAPAEVVFLNTSGGLTGGDRLRLAVALDADVAMTATTQTAERAYASPGPAAEVEVALDVARGGRLDWLPQETILFENSHLQRRTTIRLAGDATCLMAETLVLGRHAMGEDPGHARLTDRRQILRDGRPVWSDALVLGPEALASRSQPALLGAARCYAVIAFVAPGAADAASALRPLLPAPECDCALSAWNGRLILRLAARDLWPLKQQMARLLAQLRGRPLPRVWQMNGDIA